MDERDESKCYYKGNVINPGDDVDKELLKGFCIGASFCDSQGKFVYAHKDCAEIFRVLQPGCIRQYSRDKCCSIGTVCGNVTKKKEKNINICVIHTHCLRFVIGLGEEVKKLATCTFEGKTYHEGERMYPSDPKHKCYLCYCENNYQNKPIEQNKNCVKVNCNIELLETDNIKNKCVPVYHKDVCCPYDWRCPTVDDAIKPGEGKNDQTSSLKCKFGKLEFEIGDTLSSGEKLCSKCKCNIPPMLDCLFTPDC